MDDVDTTGSGLSQPFPTTVWSDVLAAADASSPRRRQLLEQLLRMYWRPVFVYVRLSWRKSVEDAKDLTQAFFVHILERDLVARVQPQRGSFRTYLKRALENFLIDARRAAQVRPFDHFVLSLDADPEELERLAPASSEEPPEAAYDRMWFDCVFKDALDALRERLRRDGKSLYFDVFRTYCFPPDGADPATVPQERTYQAVADRFGVKLTDVHNYLAHARDLLRQILRERIRGTVASDDDLEGEIELALRI